MFQKCLALIRFCQFRHPLKLKQGQTKLNASQKKYVHRISILNDTHRRCTFCCDEVP